MPASGGVGPLAALRVRLGISQAQLAARWGVSPRMVRKVERAIASGRTPKGYEHAVRELRRGVAVSPERRKNARGDLARVRGKRGEPARDVAPPPPPPARGAFGVQAGYVPGGGSSWTVTAPRTEGPGRERAREAFVAEVTSRPDDQRLAINVHTADGQTFRIGSKGGYRPEAIGTGVAGEGYDPFAWLSDVLDGMGYDVNKGRITSISLINL